MISVQVLGANKTIRDGSLDDIRKNNMTWVDAVRPNKEEIAKLSAITEVSTSDIEESLQMTQRPELRDTNHYTMIAIRSPLKPEDGKEVRTKPILLFVSKERKDFITVHHGDSRSIKRMQEYPAHKKITLFEQGATELLFALADEVIASYHTSLSEVEERISRIETYLFRPRGEKHRDIMNEILGIRKTLVYFHQALTGMREVFSSIERELSAFLDKKKLPQFRLLESDIIQLLELVGADREILSTTMQVHLSIVSNALNVTVKKVTSWGALILVPSLIASIYGMNFEHLPATDQIWGFPFLLFIMVLSVYLLFVYFRKRDWI